LIETPELEPSPVEGDYLSTSRVNAFIRLAATLGAIYVCYLLAAPFFSMLTWALTLAVLFTSPHQAIEKTLKNRTLAATVSVLLVAIILVVPILLITERLVSETAWGIDFIQTQLTSANWNRLKETNPWLASLDRWIFQQIDFQAILGDVATWLTNKGATFVQRSAAQLISVFLSLYFLFYFLRDRRAMLSTLKSFSPLRPMETDRLASRIVDTIHSIIYGTVLVAAVQGALGGVMFWWLNLPVPSLWGLAMALLSIVPALGAFVVCIPASIFLALDGNFVKAVILASWGGLIVGGVDCLLRPMLIGERLKIHTLTRFISLLGGLMLFGVAGLIIGPVAVAMTMMILDFWKGREEEIETRSLAPVDRSTVKPWHCATREETLESFGVSANGLSTATASQSLATYGPNILKETKPISPWAIFFAQFKSILIWILIGASLVSGILGDAIDSIIILAIVFLNALVGFYQEYTAEKSIAALKRMTAPRARVWRDWVVTTIASAEVVPGDILQLEAGDLVAADARLLTALSLSCVEAALTGESEAVSKSTEVIDQPELPIGDRKNMVFMGTSVATGSGRALVVATAMGTEFGNIASLIGEAGEQAGTPLQQKLEAFGRVLLWATLAIVATLFGLGLLRGGDTFDLFMTSVSLAVAALPESLPAVVTAALSLGVMRMSRRRALVRRLASVETLGSTNVICTDKTGTLTMGQMTVRKLFIAGRTYEVTGEGYAPEGEIRVEGKTFEADDAILLGKMAEVLVGCNNAYLERENDFWKVIGDPTEGALLSAGMKAAGDREQLERDRRRVYEIPFDSDRKLHSIVRLLPDGGWRILTNGAPELLLDRCSHIFTEAGIRPITEIDRQQLAEKNAEFASKALRVLGSAFRDFDAIPSPQITAETVERDLVFVGLSGLYDPPRPEAKDAVAKCYTAGIRVVMITGDHPRTAIAIARELGIETDGEVLTGVEADRLTDDSLKRKISDIDVYARVSAAHKLRIVRAWQANDAVVAMTGDGANDAPAIKGADIGIAMGRTGAEVTKQASDIIITDDNFATIVAAVEEGRGIFENIRKTLQYLLSCNAGELLLMTICIVIGLPSPLLPIHLLWINLVTDGPPALCLAADQVDASAMRKRPRERNKEIADEDFLWTMFLIAAPTAGVAFAAYVYGLQSTTIELARTYAFTALVFSQLFTALSARSQTKPIWRLNSFSNVSLLVVIVASISVQIWIQHNELFARLLKTEQISFGEGFTLLAVSALPLIALEIIKSLRSYFVGEAGGKRLSVKLQKQGAADVRETTGFGRALEQADATARKIGSFHRITAGVFVILAVAGGLLYWSLPREPAPDYVTRKAERGLAVRSVTVSGVVSPTSAVRIVARTSGVIQALYCDVGAKTTAGQLCAKIDPGPYQAVAERAKANLVTARAQLEKHETGLARAKVAFERYQRLAKRGGVSRSKLGRSKRAFERALARKKGDETRIMQLESELRAAEIDLEHTNIFSPIDGMVVSRAVGIGQTVAAGVEAPALFLIAASTARIEARVEQDDIAGVKTGDQASIGVESLPGRSFVGKVTQIRQLPQTVENVTTYEVVVSVDNADALLEPGMKATIRIVTDRRSGVRRAPGQELHYAQSDGLPPTGLDKATPSRSRPWALPDGNATPTSDQLALAYGAHAEVVE
jgi:Ca2+-transporting ATPase